MTRRAIVIGLCLSAVFAAMGFFNDMVMKQTFLFSSYMPTFLYGLVLLFVLAANPLLHRVRRGLALQRGELAAIVVLALPACFVSGRTLVHHFPGTIITPKHYNRTRLGWQRYDLLGRVPPILLAGIDPRLSREDILDPEALARKLAAAADADPASPAGRVAAAVPPEIWRTQGGDPDRETL
ncbi:MAG: hypothetical protein JXR77_07850, partial [Lentisphaeria bacterium]|nr:hypothetical protein [Lentisphaeria bacterium]